MVYFRYYLGILLEELRKITKNFSLRADIWTQNLSNKKQVL
jgi:hypothetical protein